MFVALRSARRGRSGPLTVSCLPGPADEPPRVAFAVGRAVGSAVVRNRLRRQLRSYLRVDATRVPPGTYLVRIGTGAAGRPYAELGSHLQRAIDRVWEEIGGAAGAPGGAR